MNSTEWIGWDRDGGIPIVAQYRAEIRDDFCFVYIDGMERIACERPFWPGLVESVPQLAQLLTPQTPARNKN